jgi:hypothetical protein
MMKISEIITTIETPIIMTPTMTITTNSIMHRDRASSTCRETLTTNNVSITETAERLERLMPISTQKIKTKMMIIRTLIPHPRKNKSSRLHKFKSYKKIKRS